MIISRLVNRFNARRHEKLWKLLQRPLALAPLAPLQPLLRRIVTGVTDMNPELFNRLGPHKNKRFLIDPTNMPFVMVLCPNPDKPELRAYKRHEVPAWDACISGTFLKLLDMVDGRLDGDALFFTRDLMVEGDTEAVVTLRNAMDDVEGSIPDDIAASCGIFSPAVRRSLNFLREFRDNNNELKPQTNT